MMIERFTNLKKERKLKAYRYRLAGAGIKPPCGASGFRQEVLSGQGKREGISLSGKYTGAERK
jgi:hypothetical protein